MCILRWPEGRPNMYVLLDVTELNLFINNHSIMFCHWFARTLMTFCCIWRAPLVKHPLEMIFDNIKMLSKEGAPKYQGSTCL